MGNLLKVQLWNRLCWMYFGVEKDGIVQKMFLEIVLCLLVGEVVLVDVIDILKYNGVNIEKLKVFLSMYN